MEDPKLQSAAPEDCTGNCHTCGSSCASTEGGERKPSFFDKMDYVSSALEEVGEDEIIRILNETMDEWEAEDA